MFGVLLCYKIIMNTYIVFEFLYTYTPVGVLKKMKAWNLKLKTWLDRNDVIIYTRI